MLVFMNEYILFYREWDTFLLRTGQMRYIIISSTPHDIANCIKAFISRYLLFIDNKYSLGLVLNIKSIKEQV